jgi:hypothetical protein
MSRRVDEALDKLQKLAGVGAPFAARTGAEARYNEAYQQDVREGIASQLKAKYRRGNVGKRMAGGGSGAGKGQSKGQPHPDVHGFRRHGYRVEARWNPRDKSNAESTNAAKAAE